MAPKCIPFALAIFTVVFTGAVGNDAVMKPAQSSLPVQPTKMLLWGSGEEAKAAITPSSPTIQRIIDEAYATVKHSPYQWLNALIALSLGSMMIIKGEKFFVYCIIFFWGFAVAGGQISTLLGLHYTSSLSYIVAVETGLISAYTAYKGIEGMLVLFAVMLGMFFAMTIKKLAVENGANFLEIDEIMVCFYSLFALLGYVCFYQKRTLWFFSALISPALGGALFTSALSYGVTSLVVVTNVDIGLQPKMGSYIEFLTLLFSSKSQDVGLFVGHYIPDGQFVVGLFDGMCWDCLFGRGLWLFLFLIGASLQFRFERKDRAARMTERAARMTERAAKKKIVSAREPELTKGLLSSV